MQELPKQAIPGQILAPQFDLLEPIPTSNNNSDNETSSNEEPTIIMYINGAGTKLINYPIGNNSKNSKEITVISSTKLGKVYSYDVDAPSDYKTIDESRKIQFKMISVGNSELMKQSQGKNESSNILPREGDVILCRVSRISLQRANVEILAVSSKNIPIDSGVGTNGSGTVAVQGGSGAQTFSVSQASSDVGETFRGIIRSQDVRATDRDKVVMIDCFKPGDIVKAQVISLGDGNNYYLTTARNDLGVIFARANNGAGGLMYATDWLSMTSPLSGITEKRKCANPF
ncbi:similar to Saccharomyces cerevisiae YNL232W CSL4 Exosome non-catalytic core component [Maudiozyma saulgeensis]|uniref:Similar to Saccharomyces cerevisiae YNL232W CSL4 Exosome non-catalytic core component n=1 Tax=Maudiozyma saulgeensis TaxID=1789683 RepID=A0A1X7R260_9SACH|nr:similar to Saccharomyces cerevisiae YNL232W CSL4 Exosome non-catalytic core component [Kazachstania saulgeensis]